MWSLLRPTAWGHPMRQELNPATAEAVEYNPATAENLLPSVPEGLWCGAHRRRKEAAPPATSPCAREQHRKPTAAPDAAPGGRAAAACSSKSACVQLLPAPPQGGTRSCNAAVAARSAAVARLTGAQVLIVSAIAQAIPSHLGGVLFELCREPSGSLPMVCAPLCL